MVKAMTSRRGSSGYTLAELLTVIAIVALLGGLSAGAYQVARRNYGLQGSAGRIQGVVRAARNAAITTGSPSQVIIDPVARRVWTQAHERVGEWSFEGSTEGDAPAGLGGPRASFAGGGLAPGRVGQGASFRKGGEVTCGQDPRFDLRTGLIIEAWVRHDNLPPVRDSTKDDRPQVRKARRGARRAANGGSAAAILKKEGAYGLGMTQQGALEGFIGGYAVRTEDSEVPAGRWVHVVLRYDGLTLSLEVDGVPRESLPLVAPGGAAGKEEKVPAAAPVTPSQLTISDARAPFPGEIDEVRLSGAAEPVEYTWPPDEHVPGWKKVIHFDRQGRLDAGWHQDPVRILLVELPDAASAAPPTTQVAVDYSVTFEEWQARFRGRDVPSLAVEEAKLEAVHAGRRQVLLTIDRLGVIR